MREEDRRGSRIEIRYILSVLSRTKEPVIEERKEEARKWPGKKKRAVGLPDTLFGLKKSVKRKRGRTRTRRHVLLGVYEIKKWKERKVSVDLEARKK